MAKTDCERNATHRLVCHIRREHPHLNFVSCSVEKGEKSTNFSWVTDLPTTPIRKMLPLIERGGRTGWKIENETFKTLKNQGYHFEHNCGHGFKNLSTVLILLLILAFLVDPTQQLDCPLFQAAGAKINCKRRLWEKMRALFFVFSFDNMAALYETIVRGHIHVAPILLLPFDSS